MALLTAALADEARSAATEEMLLYTDAAAEAATSVVGVGDPYSASEIAELADAPMSTTVACAAS